MYEHLASQRMKLWTNGASLKLHKIFIMPLKLWFRWLHVVSTYLLHCSVCLGFLYIYLFFYLFFYLLLDMSLE